MIWRRDVPKGVLVRVHLVDDTSVEGRVERCGRKFLALSKARIESNGVWHETRNEALLVPRRPDDRVKLVEVVGS